MRRLLALAFIIVLGTIAMWLPRQATSVSAQGRQAPAGTAHTGDAFRFNKVREGVYHAVGTGSLAVVGNSSFIVNDDDVIVVDDHVSPAAAWVLLEEIRKVTNKPVTTVINTHFHFDHAHGNQIFDGRVSIIGHEFTRQMLLSNSIGMPLYSNYLTGLQPQIDDLKKRLASESDATTQASLERQINVAQNNLASQRELKPTPPNVTLTDRMTLYRGSREIQIRYLGRGHTAGDIVVFLPREKVVMTGDFLTAGLSNMSDSFPDEWVKSLDNLKTLDFDAVLPGHGEAFTDKAKIGYFQDYLRDVWTEVSRLKQQGVSAEDAARRADLTKHSAHLPINGPGVPLIGVQRIYALLDQRAAR